MAETDVPPFWDCAGSANAKTNPATSNPAIDLKRCI
jgi:hypothetical protein